MRGGELPFLALGFLAGSALGNQQWLHTCSEDGGLAGASEDSEAVIWKQV